MHTFQSMELTSPILSALDGLGFENPTPVQSEVIPFVLSESRDLIALARTGTGKTAAFGIPLLQLIDHADSQSKIDRGTQALVISPTRELCMQIASELEDLGAEFRGLDVLPVYGGAAMGPQIKRLRRGPQIVVATPGRLLDMLRRDVLDTGHIRYLVLDEADEMLRLGFREDLEAIMSGIPDGHRTLLFSATMPKEIRTIAATYLDDPFEISLISEESAPSTIEHGYYMVRESDRYGTLSRIAASEPDMYGIVFCRTKEETRTVGERLAADGFATGALHGDLTQAQRDTVMAGFRSRAIHLLAATDVAARGIDVADLTHVIHYRLPDGNEGYIHRSGRTGRVGKKGKSLVILSPNEGYRLKRIERRIKTTFERLEVPSWKEVAGTRIKNIVEGLLEEPSGREHVEEFLPLAVEALADLSRSELIERMLTRELEPISGKSRSERDIPTVKERRDADGNSFDRGRRRDRKYGSQNRRWRDDGEERQDRRDGRRKRPDEFRSRKGKTPRRQGNWTKLVVSAGSQDGMTTGDLFKLINSGGESRGVSVGVIKIMARKTSFEIPAGSAGPMISGLSGLRYAGKDLRIQPA